ncbi:FG-GAP-like repeat-containing protein [Paenarthrobacter ilicis]|uniref:FG-GAP-like repeat-containing protein n=1 Tax=Paenarthrobacter ilicis TaxID=43665 RepID=UPI00300A58F2
MYVGTGFSDKLMVVEGDTDAVSYLEGPGSLYAVAVNERTNKVFAAGARADVTVFDGVRGTFSRVPTGYSPKDVGVNQATGRVYVANSSSDTVTVIDGNDAAPKFTQSAPPDQGAVGVSYSFKFAATGSPAPKYQVSDGSVPPGLRLNDETGELSGKPEMPGRYSFRVTASNGSDPAVVTDHLTLSIERAKNDFNRDRKADVLVRDSAGTMSLYAGNGMGGWSWDFKPIGYGWETMSTINTGDFTSDGNADILARDSSGTLWIYPSDGKGGWTARLKVGPGWNGMTAILAPGHMDFDSREDIVARDSAGNLWVYYQTLEGSWMGPFNIGSGWNVMTAIIAPGDLNGDDTPDLLARDSSGNLWLYPRGGNYFWQPRVQVGSGWNGMTTILGAGDFNGDGTADVHAVDGAGTLWLYPGNGKGGWLPRVHLGSGWNSVTAVS